MKEIEVKILEINKEEIILKLEKLGAKKVFDDKLSMITFKLPPKISRNIDLFAVRAKGKDVFLTLKKKKEKHDIKIQEEIEFKIEDYEKAREMFLALGFKILGEPKKYRVSYKLGEIHFEIDTLEGIPTFLEIEAPSLKEIEKAVKLLGYSMKDANNWGGKELFKHYNIRL